MNPTFEELGLVLEYDHRYDEHTYWESQRALSVRAGEGFILMQWYWGWSVIELEPARFVASFKEEVDALRLIEILHKNLKRDEVEGRRAIRVLREAMAAHVEPKRTTRLRRVLGGEPQ